MKIYRKAASLILGTGLIALLAMSLPTYSADKAASKQSGALAKAPYRDATLPTDQRVADLLGRMTLEEKIAQITSLWEDKPKVQHDDFSFDPDKASKLFPNGLGQLSRPSDRKGPVSPRVVPKRSVAESVAYVNAVQDWAIKKTRLGIPVLFHEEALHGLAGTDATSFPQPIALASTWDPALIRAVNSQIATEAHARGVRLVLSPVVDVARDPRWGRIEETFGEDPFLVGEMGVAAVEGLQGGDRTRVLAKGKVFATLKHLTGHGQPESGSNIGPAPIAERTLREMFFPPFEQVVKRTGVDALMPSYNEIDGVPSHANKWLLTNVLRGEWGYQGAIVSDYYAIDQLANLHHLVPDIAAAAKRALDAGVDDDLPNGGAYGSLADAVRRGEVPISAIDTAVSRVLKLKFNAGLFEQPYANLRDASSSDGPEAITLARHTAERSLVLLKNDGTLPLSLTTANSRKPTLAVIGPSAAMARLGGYSGAPRATVSPLAGIRAFAGDKANVVFSEGVKITEDDDWWADDVKLADPAANRERITAAVTAAKNADTILLFIGDTEQTSREGWTDSHLGDRSSLDLVGDQQRLFDSLKELGKPIVVVLVNGRPPSYPKVAAQANAILETWYAGEQAGNAIADAVFGKINPGGKLPVSVARDAGQLPVYYNYKPTARRGYLFSDITPLYPFGFGLSYTTFTIGKPTLSESTIKAGAGFSVNVSVTNTGRVAGDEVVQIYLRDDVSSVTRPIKELVGFERVTLQPGETRVVKIPVRANSLALWNTQMRRVVEPGTFTVMAGANSADVSSTTLTVAE